MGFAVVDFRCQDRRGRDGPVRPGGDPLAAAVAIVEPDLRAEAARGGADAIAFDPPTDGAGIPALADDTADFICALCDQRGHVWALFKDLVFFARHHNGYG